MGKSGSGTLLWAVVFSFCYIFVASLLFRAILGPNPADNEEIADPATVGFYFQSVPRSMLTTYRCSFGDCSTKLGTPIVEYTEQELGLVASLSLSCFLFIAAVGFFNIISAVFLERIMAYLATKMLDGQRERLHDKELWHERLTRFIDIQIQLNNSTKTPGPEPLTTPGPEPLTLIQRKRGQLGYKWLTQMSHDSLAKRSFSKELLDLSVEYDLEAKKILADLDIEPQDCLSLSQTLDRNQNGRIDVTELVTGLSRLRGPARRSDIVAVDLAVQSMQTKMDEIWLDHCRRKSLAEGDVVNI